MRANMVSVIVWQLKTVVAYLLAVVVKDAKFWLHNPNEYKMKNQRKLETAGFFVGEQRDNLHLLRDFDIIETDIKRNE